MSDIKATLKLDEGYISKARHITTQGGGKGEYSIGHGYNLNSSEDPRRDLLEAGVPEDKVEGVIAGRYEIDKDVADKLLDTSVHRAADAAALVVPQYHNQPDAVKKVMVELSFQLGGNGLKKFKNMRASIAGGDYKAAARHLLDSKLARKDSTKRAQKQAQELVEYASSIEPTKTKEGKRSSRVEELKRANRRLLAKRSAEGYGISAAKKPSMDGMMDVFKGMMDKQKEGVKAPE